MSRLYFFIKSIQESIVNSPLKQVRLKRKKSLQQVADAVGIDTGNLSRIERGLQVPSKGLTEKLSNYFGNEVTETQIIYPERFIVSDATQPAVNGH